MPWAVFVHRWGEVRGFGPGRVEREELWRAPVSAAEALWLLGLVQRAFDDWEGRPVEMAFVPEDLLLYAPKPEPLEIPKPSTGTPPAHTRTCADTLADNLVSLWAGLQRDPDGTGISEAKQDHGQFLITLSLEQGWLRADPAGRARPVAKAMLDWLRADPWTQWATLAKAWLSSTAWNDLAHVPTLRPDPAHGWPNDPASTRQGLIDHLNHCLTDTAYDIGTFAAYVQTHGTFFLRRDGDYDTWAPRSSSAEAPLRGFDAWDAVEGELIRYVITGPLHWLGLVDLGSDDPEGSPCSFALTQAGAALLQDSDPPRFAALGPVQLGEDAVLSIPRHRRYERFQLGRIADEIIAQESDAFRYRLSPSSLGRARQQRIPLARIIGFLLEATGRETLPANLEAAIRGGYQENAPATLGQHWVLRVPDPQVLEVPAIASLITQQIAPGVVALRAEDQSQACQLLLENGILVDLDDPY